MSELRALSTVAVDALDRVVTTPVEQTHRAIARRAFAVNALIGDLLEDEGSELAIGMAVRNLSAARAGAGPRLALFVHGLGENEDAWRLGGRRPYGELLADELGLSPLYLRYNSGLHVSENGRRLAGLLDELVEEWPVEVEELVLVGHSMGGLVLRAACHHAQQSGSAWAPLVTHVVYLGAPHLGAPLERLLNAAGYALAIAPESRGFAGILETRSAGIKDLRYGYVCDEDWDGHDANALLRNTGTDVPLMDGPAHCFVAACTGRDPEGRLASVMGDLLVGVASASGPRGCDIELDRVRRLRGLNHFQLLNHPRVYAELKAWLRAGREETVG